MSANVLAARDANAAISFPQREGADKPKTGLQRKLLNPFGGENDAANKYTSPSDNMMSPCTAKLAAMKNKRFSKGRPLSLFNKAKFEQKDEPISEPQKEENVFGDSKDVAAPRQESEE